MRRNLLHGLRGRWWRRHSSVFIMSKTWHLPEARYKTMHLNTIQKAKTTGRDCCRVLRRMSNRQSDFMTNRLTFIAAAMDFWMKFTRMKTFDNHSSLLLWDYHFFREFSLLIYVTLKRFVLFYSFLLLSYKKSYTYFCKINVYCSIINLFQSNCILFMSMVYCISQAFFS